METGSLPLSLIEFPPSLLYYYEGAEFIYHYESQISGMGFESYGVLVPPSKEDRQFLQDFTRLSH